MQSSVYVGVIVPAALCEAKAWGISSVERKKVILFEMMCLRSLVGVTPMDLFRNEEVHRRALISNELASCVDQRLRLIRIFL